MTMCKNCFSTELDTGFTCMKCGTDNQPHRGIYSSAAEWIKCPKCDGQGIVSKPPYVAGDQNTWTDTQTIHTCNLCNGSMVILKTNRE